MCDINFQTVLINYKVSKYQQFGVISTVIIIISSQMRTISPQKENLFKTLKIKKI